MRITDIQQREFTRNLRIKFNSKCDPHPTFKISEEIDWVVLWESYSESKCLQKYGTELELSEG